MKIYKITIIIIFYHKYLQFLINLLKVNNKMNKINFNKINSNNNNKYKIKIKIKNRNNKFISHRNLKKILKNIF